MEKIERVEDQDKLLIQNSIKYLNSITKIKELNVPTLKSLYRTKCRLMELRRHIYLPPEKPNRRCQRCFMNFSEGKTKYEVRPTKLSAFAKKILKKMNTNKVLTKFQRSYYKKLRKMFPNGFQKQNKMVITCGFCKKELETRMTKPKMIPKVVKNTPTPAKKKKKSKKDKFCGLNENAVNQSASKKKKLLNNIKLSEHKTPCNISTNRFVGTNHSKHLLNASVSMTNTRVFETADFIPLEADKRKGNQIKFSKKKENFNRPPILPVPKLNEKLHNKNMKSLGNILKRAGENQGLRKNSHSSSLKKFLAGL